MRILTVFFAILFSCIMFTEAQTTKKWTVLVYLDADNDLEKYGIIDVNEMEQVGSDANVNIVVQFDRIPGEDDSNGDWTGTRRYYVTKDTDTATINSTMVQDMGEINMGDGASLTNFLRWGMTNYPAERYFVIMWNHGGGWRSKAPITTTTSLVKGVCWDYTDGHDYLTMAEVNTSLNTIATEFTHPINIVGFDACIMGLAEIAYMVKGPVAYPTETVIFSQANEPGEGWDYAGFLASFVANYNDTALELSKDVVDTYYESYNGVTDTTLSVVDMTAFSAFVTSLNAFSTGVTREWNILQHAVLSATLFNAAYRDLIHITDYCRKNYISTELLALAEDLYQKSVAFAPYCKNTGSFSSARGLNIYFPLSTSDSEWSAYTTANVYMLNDVPWRTFLSTFFSADKTPPSAPLTPSVASEASGYRVSWSAVTDASGYVLRERVISESLADSSFDTGTLGEWSTYSGVGYSAFTVSSEYSHSPSYSVFSGSTDNLKRGIQSSSITIPNDSRDFALSLWVNYNTESGFDFLYIDVLEGSTLHNLAKISGDSSGWTQLTYDLSAFKGDSVRIILRYETDTSISNMGVYVDDIQVVNQVITTVNAHADLSYLITDNLDGTYHYSVSAYDASGNISNYSSEVEYYHTSSPTIIVTSPNGGERIIRGSDHVIRWNDNITDNVKIELYKGGSFDSVIVSSTESDGTYTWTVPVSQTIGSDYRIVITSIADADLHDQSNADCTINDIIITAHAAVNGAIWGYASIYINADAEISSSSLNLLIDTDLTVYNVEMIGTGNSFFRSANTFNTHRFSNGTHTVYVRYNGTTVQTVPLIAAEIYPGAVVRFSNLFMNVTGGNGNMIIVYADIDMSNCPVSTSNKPVAISFDTSSEKCMEINNPYGKNGALLQWKNDRWILTDYSRERLTIHTAGTYLLVDDSLHTMIPVVKTNELEQNYPNPFNPSTEIPVKLAEAADIHLSIREIIILAHGHCNAGLTVIPWDGRDKRGNTVPSGVYYYKLTVNGKTFVKKMIMLK